ncbi:M15 family metallopeptidase [Agromyces atrinae]|uniref:Peptidase M15 n=1 Tax=Agromyces atrinae TaxID=592376 RepID=A0A4Q2MC47_9MICO|nr:M15 family metallopeptidase [Agromyces atrinae]NYD66329.1 hypothetical protein [Agromyces atrinae]RXZ86650.1 peptidase M15 [Agromyces atrinae]
MTRTRTRRLALFLTALVLAGSAATIGYLLLAPSTSSLPSPSSLLGSGLPAAPEHADGEVPDGTTVVDDDIPAVGNLDPELLAAVRRAAEDAAAEDLTFFVNGGWRSAAYQERLLREAVDEYGSEEEAARWVATPETSAHVSGDAIDIGMFAAAAWLDEHGDAYGLCRIYDNEPWHFELRPDAVTEGCPTMYWDPTFDPRMTGGSISEE